MGRLRSGGGFASVLLQPFVLYAAISAAQTHSLPLEAFEVTADLTPPALQGSAHGKQTALPPAVLWLKPLEEANALRFPAHGKYALLQKNKIFSPHLLVVPVGASVAFPNRDPYYHNVFSLFDGKRFDLGLYEAGKTKDVEFSREGVSYIFCNIHSEMSAVVISLTTPLYSIADARGHFAMGGVVAGDYEMLLWIEGQPQATLDSWTRTVHLSEAHRSLGDFPIPPPLSGEHKNKFGQPYTPESTHSY